MFDTIVSIGTILLQLFVVVTIIALVIKAPFAKIVATHSTLLLRVIFTGAVIGSLIYSEIMHFAPCILCWYQRLAIFPIAILSYTGHLTKSSILRLQVLLLSAAGLMVALYHKYIEIFPRAGGVCGPDGIACDTLYVFQFGYITIPMMSLTILSAGILLTILADRFSTEQA